METLLSQTCLPSEILISDDGSCDDTVAIVNKFIKKNGNLTNWRILQNKHKGPGAARNFAIREAKGDWIAFLDSDDSWLDKKIETIQEVIKRSPEKNFFCHDELLIPLKGKVRILNYGRKYRPSLPLPPQIYLSNMFSTSAVVCRRDLLIINGLFDETLMSAQDYELWLRLSCFIKPVFIYEVLGKYVERKGNITNSKFKMRFSNEIKIALKYSKSFPFYLVAIRIVRIVLSFGFQFIRSRF